MIGNKLNGKKVGGRKQPRAAQLEVHPEDMNRLFVCALGTQGLGAPVVEKPEGNSPARSWRSSQRR